MHIQTSSRWKACGALVTGLVLAAGSVAAQDRDRQRERDWDASRDRITRIESGTVIAVRTNERIEAERFDPRIYTGVVEDSVWGTDGRLAIPRGATVELMVREARDHDLILDLESVMIRGERYGLRADAERIDSRSAVGSNRRTGEYAGGGAVIGAIIGAIAGGGKGAAIGAASGAAAGVGALAFRGRSVKLPAETVVTFRLDRGLEIGIPDSGYDREGRHYHGPKN